MKVITQLTDPGLIASLKTGGVAVVRTDTLYGLVVAANNEAAVEKIYQLKHRDPQKSCIVLIADESQLLDGTQWTESYRRLAATYWPGPVTIITPVDDHVPDYLQRHNGSMAYRLPANDGLQALLKLTGPLIAPSANPEGEIPAVTIDQAIGYFGEAVDYYVDGGTCDHTSGSTILRLNEAGHEEVLR